MHFLSDKIPTHGKKQLHHLPSRGKSGFVTKTVNKAVLLEAIAKREPLGKEKLAVETDLLPVSAIDKMLCRNPRVPSRATARFRLSRVIGVPEPVLFPEVKPGKKRA